MPEVLDKINKRMGAYVEKVLKFTFTQYYQI